MNKLTLKEFLSYSPYDYDCVIHIKSSDMKSFCSNFIYYKKLDAIKYYGDCILDSFSLTADMDFDESGKNEVKYKVKIIMRIHVIKEGIEI